jgi:hypothetical protein
LLGGGLILAAAAWSALAPGQAHNKP